MVLIAVLILIFLALLWAFLAMPQWPPRPMTAFAGRDYAHRGLWSPDGPPENSLTAFRLAAEAGFGIELDVQRTVDGELVVFHDDSLERMCGVRKPLTSCTYAELQACPLLSGDETIPTFAEVLREVAGRVPLIVEIKQGPDVAETCRLADAMLQRYPGLACVESFDPRAVRWFRKNRPQRIRGQLAAFPTRRSVCGRSAKTLMLGLMVCNVLSRPDFVAHETATDRSPFFRAVRRMGASTVAWTVRSQEEMDRLRGRYDLQIFDSFLPREEEPFDPDEAQEEYEAGAPDGAGEPLDADEAGVPEEAGPLFPPEESEAGALPDGDVPADAQPAPLRRRRAGRSADC